MKSQTKPTASEQLERIAPLVTRHPQGYLRNLNTLKEDGQDHINIWENGKTTMGRALHPFADLPFEHSEHGKFRSIEGFWYWILSASRPNRLRAVHGIAARSLGRSLESQVVENFREIIAGAMWQKLNQYPALRKEIAELPADVCFDSYYISPEDQTTRVRTKAASWMVAAVNVMRNAINEDVEPNFEFLRGSARQNSGEPSLRSIYATKKERPPIAPKAKRKHDGHGNGKPNGQNPQREKPRKTAALENTGNQATPRDDIGLPNTKDLTAVRDDFPKSAEEIADSSAAREEVHVKILDGADAQTAIGQAMAAARGERTFAPREETGLKTFAPQDDHGKQTLTGSEFVEADGGAAAPGTPDSPSLAPDTDLSQAVVTEIAPAATEAPAAVVVGFDK